MMELLATVHQKLGHMQMARQEGDVLFGTFHPEAAFQYVAPLFRDFEASVDAQALHALETFDAAIAALGLHLRDPITCEAYAVVDVQIWSDGGMTCRLGLESMASAPLPQYSAVADGMQPSHSTAPR